MSVQIANGPLLPAARRVHVFADRAAWVEGRRLGIGSSDVAAILGVSPYRSGWDVYAERVLEREERADPRREKIFARGHREEPRILEDYAEETGARVLPTRQVIVEGAAPLAVSTDSFVELGGEGWGVGEAKTDRSGASWGSSGVVIERWSAAAREIVREDHAAQLYSQLLATGLPYGVLAVRRDMDDLRHYTLLADERLQGRMAERLAEWWDRHVVRREPPDNDGSEACARAKERMFGRGRDKTLRKAKAAEIELAMKIVATKTEVQRLQDLERKLRADMADAIGEGYGLSWDTLAGTSKVLFIDVAGRELVDADRLRREHPEVHAKVVRTTEPSRQIRLYL